MPYVNVQITREGNTPEQKRQVIAAVTQVLVEVLGKDPDTTFVVIDEVDVEDWGIGGVPVDVWRARRSRPASAPSTTV
jgi:4-oxalocrotonate tautomerase